MGHRLTALIGSRHALARLIEQLGPPATTDLGGDLIIMPLGTLRLALLQEPPGPPFDGFEHFTSEVAAFILCAIGTKPVIYIETNYFGGAGTQGAAFFSGGKLIWKRAISTEGPTQPGKTPISEGLAALGVGPAIGRDEFDVVRLGRFRSVEDLGMIEWEDED